MHCNINHIKNYCPMNTTDQLFNNTILFQDTENIEGTVKNVYLRQFFYGSLGMDDPRGYNLWSKIFNRFSKVDSSMVRILPNDPEKLVCNDPEKLVWFLELSITDNRDQIISENYDKALSFYKETLNEIQDYLDLSNAFQYIGLGNTKLYITFIAEI